MPKGLNNPASYGNYPAYFGALTQLAQQYGHMPVDNVYNAYARAASDMSPQTQNRRVKGISSLPVEYGKEKIAEMLKSPDGNELGLRQAAHSLEWGAYPYYKIRKTYQDLNTYRYYFYPAYLESSEIDDAFWREGTLLDKFTHEMKPDQWAHQIVGECLQEGKVAYIPRFSVDKAHNKINYAFMQRLPSDYWKIVGFNNVSKYTVMFDMMYFMQPGADWRQFGDLFAPYVNDFSNIFDVGAPSSYIFASGIKTSAGYLNVNLEKFNEVRKTAAGKPELYSQNGRWAYWVTLPVDRAWVFEIDDATRTVVTPLTGLFLAMDQLSSYEAVQMEIVQNPLVSVVLGEIPYFSDKDNSKGEPDRYQLSPAGRAMFEAYWYQMLSAANTGGIGFYTGPFEHMQLASLNEAPNATDISTKGYQYAVSKSGLSGLIPINDNPRAGSVNVSVSLEERFASVVCSQFENMMDFIFKSLNPTYEWRFKLFGGMQADEKDLKTAKDGMASGILSEVFRWYALRGISLFSDLAMSRAIKASGILDLRIPLVSSYSMKQESSGLPPQPENSGGRPPADIDDLTSEGTEDGLDD